MAKNGNRELTVTALILGVLLVMLHRAWGFGSDAISARRCLAAKARGPRASKAWERSFRPDLLPERGFAG
ncbi:MAG: hypothetical protein IKJ89_04565 [Kiritimatiellae bacterium]|nr:hypothetical protein [Kiritimatiellia bacterium]